MKETFELYLDVKKETYDEKYIDNENEKDPFKSPQFRMNKI